MHVGGLPGILGAFWPLVKQGFNLAFKNPFTVIIITVSVNCYFKFWALEI